MFTEEDSCEVLDGAERPNGRANRRDMRQIASRHGVTHLGMPSFRDAVGRTSA